MQAEIGFLGHGSFIVSRYADGQALCSGATWALGRHRYHRNWFAQHRPRTAAVPFEAAALRMARVCEDERDGLVAVLRDFANSGTRTSCHGPVCRSWPP